ncbi:hypothetical protein GMSM_21470 [Geomonas sp. Red276]
MTTAEQTLPRIDTARTRMVCDYLPRPFPDCYCMNISSSTIGKMLTYCIGNFPSCPVYQEHRQPEGKP